MAGPARTSFSPSPPPPPADPSRPGPATDQITGRLPNSGTGSSVASASVRNPVGNFLGGRAGSVAGHTGLSGPPWPPRDVPRVPSCPSCPAAPRLGSHRPGLCSAPAPAPPVLPLSTGGGGVGGGSSLDGEPLQGRPFLLSRPPGPGQHGPGSQEAPATLRNRTPLLLLEFSSSLLQGKPGGQSASPGACLGMTVTERQEKGRPGPDLPLQV